MFILYTSVYAYYDNEPFMKYLPVVYEKYLFILLSLNKLYLNVCLATHHID